MSDTLKTADSNVAIELIGVEKAFDGNRVHNGVNLKIPAGKTTIITGGSGQGKSVILKMMLGLIRPDRGRVIVFGQDVARASTRQLRTLREQFGVLFQSVALFDSMTIFDNVALPLRERTHASEADVRAKVTEKLAMMDLEGVDDKFPAQLSGGMLKRAGLARALILEPKIVFFDEPTSGLDAKHSAEIYRVFHRTQAQLGYTAVIVSHDIPKIFKLSDQVALLADGVIQGVMSPQAFNAPRSPPLRRLLWKPWGQFIKVFPKSGVFMNRRNAEITVGLFVVAGFLAFSYLSINLGGVPLFGSDRYTVEARFGSIAGLKVGAAIEISGVQIGKVTDIRLDQDEYEAVVELALDPGINLQEDSIASIRTAGIIGDRFVDIQPGGMDELIPPGGRIIETESAINLEELLSKYIFESE